MIPEVKVIDVADRQQDLQENRVTDPDPTAITGADATTDLEQAIRDTDDVLAKDENRVNADDNETLIDADRHDRLKPTMKREQEGSRSAEILNERRSTVPDRPKNVLKEGEVDQPNFDEIWLPEDSWVPDRGESEYKVGKITDMRTGRRTRYGRSYRECVANWKGYDATDWIDDTDLNCEALMHEFLRDRSYQKQFDMLQFREEE
ncbi:hypothetical protein PR003_g31820 [Phytophthora rubi]|uniref:Chromo domain-containing protein n=1 Tax=Phytophthora rubi TaxID=129364 RepID=A0A6A3H204_9STRA|nr:hypothetical protein PR001_g29324 [Phytophthora rubi]KAE8985138.1 hypothetical protein PR002_g22730 [Phytophthora rubi]KAE9267314.1 hypothetical protein PR003_g31820 [Phytophthora rubi]